MQFVDYRVFIGYVESNAPFKNSYDSEVCGGNEVALDSKVFKGNIFQNGLAPFGELIVTG